MTLTNNFDINTNKLLKNGFKNDETPLDADNLNTLIDGINEDYALINGVNTNLSRSIENETNTRINEDKSIVKSIWGNVIIPEGHTPIQTQISNESNERTTADKELSTRLSNLEETLDKLDNTYATDTDIEELESMVNGLEETSKDSYSNTLKGHIEGSSKLQVDDISPVTHRLNVKVKENNLPSSGVSVSKYGKNMFNLNQTTHSGSSKVSSLGSDSITITHPTSPTVFYKWISANFCVDELLVDRQVTISANVSTSGKNNAVIRLGWVKSDGTAHSEKFLSTNIVTGDGMITKTGVIPEKPSSEYSLCLMLYSNGNADLENGIEYTTTFSNVQLELGDTITEYCPYVESQTIKSNTTGDIVGLTSAYPTTILICNNPDITISCNYNKDINKAMDELFTITYIIDGGGAADADPDSF